MMKNKKIRKRNREKFFENPWEKYFFFL